MRGGERKVGLRDSMRQSPLLQLLKVGDTTVYFCICLIFP